MALTEEQARTKMCPLLVAGSAQLASAAGVESPIQCVAADCMMWRWQDDPDGKYREGRGYCGLAGAEAA